MILFEETGGRDYGVALMYGAMAIAMPSQRQLTSIFGARHRKQEPQTPSAWTGEETHRFSFHQERITKTLGS
jgi:NAD(P)H-flavin reductase